MARTRIEDLPIDIKISRQEMGRSHGGVMTHRAEAMAHRGGTPEEEASDGYYPHPEQPPDQGCISTDSRLWRWVKSSPPPDPITT